MRAVLNKGTVEEIKLYMRSLGWSSEDRLCRWGYYINFNRYDWHGVQLAVNLSISSDRVNPDITDIHQTVIRAARLALKAWETYSDSVPRQDAKGNLVLDPKATQRFLERRTLK